MPKEEVEKEKHIVVKIGCPKFSGKSEDYEEWRMKVDDWMWLTRKEVEAPGMVIRQGLEGKALEATLDIEKKMMRSREGGERVLEKLDEVFKKEKVWEVYGRVVKYLKIEREKKESMTSYLLRYETVSAECKKVGAKLLEGETKACHLLEQGNLTENQRQMVISACGVEELEYDKIRKVMKRMFEGLELEDKREDDWWGRDGREAVQSFERKEGKKQNPMRGGVVSRCVICKSEYHWARECPKSYRNKNKKEERENEGIKGEKVWKKEKGNNQERVFTATVKEEEKKDYWSRVEAIIDTGCNSTVVGEV